MPDGSLMEFGLAGPVCDIESHAVFKPRQAEFGLTLLEANADEYVEAVKQVLPVDQRVTLGGIQRQFPSLG